MPHRIQQDQKYFNNILNLKGYVSKYFPVQLFLFSWWKITIANGGSHKILFIFQNFRHLLLCIPHRLDKNESLKSPSYLVQQLKAGILRLQVTQGNISVPTTKVLLNETNQGISTTTLH